MAAESKGRKREIDAVIDRRRAGLAERAMRDRTRRHSDPQAATLPALRLFLRQLEGCAMSFSGHAGT